MFSKEASEEARLDEKGWKDKKRKDGRQEEKGQSSKKRRDEAARPINTNYKHPLQRHYDKYNIYIL
ncbi:MAG: hypothetical protein EGQ32_05315 [Prevotella sp.]|nr:hypothetical protein [Prevotella sp.]